MRRLIPLVPAFCAFGPLLMVIGYDTPYHILSYVAALITSGGMLIIFAIVAQLLMLGDGASSQN